MKITVQIAIQSDEGQTAALQEVACLERGALRPDTLGLSLGEARSILAGLEQALVERQAVEFVVQAQRCPRCGRERACKGHHRIVFRTPFGKLKLDSPQLYRCPCEPQESKSFSPLAELLPERTRVEKTVGCGSGAGGLPAHRHREPCVPAPEGVLQDRQPDLDRLLGTAPALSAPAASWPCAG